MGVYVLSSFCTSGKFLIYLGGSRREEPVEGGGVGTLILNILVLLHVFKFYNNYEFLVIFGVGSKYTRADLRSVLITERSIAEIIRFPHKKKLFAFQRTWEIQLAFQFSGFFSRFHRGTGWLILRGRGGGGGTVNHGCGKFYWSRANRGPSS